MSECKYTSDDGCVAFIFFVLLFMMQCSTCNTVDSIQRELSSNQRCIEVQ